MGSAQPQRALPASALPNFPLPMAHPSIKPYLMFPGLAINVEELEVASSFDSPKSIAATPVAALPAAAQGAAASGASPYMTPAGLSSLRTPVSLQFPERRYSSASVVSAVAVVSGASYASPSKSGAALSDLYKQALQASPLGRDASPVPFDLGLSPLNPEHRKRRAIDSR